MRFLLALSLLILCASAGAQDADRRHDDGPTFHVKVETELERGRERTLLGDMNLNGVWGAPTYNYSRTGDDWALVRGGMGGLEFGHDFFLGYGGWKSRDNFTTDDDPDMDTRPEYEFRHGGFILGFAPGSTKSAIHPRITTILGPGRIELTKEFVSMDQPAESERFFVGQVMGGIEANVTQWFRLGLEGGYRFAGGVDHEKITASDISGAVIQVEARFGFAW